MAGIYLYSKESAFAALELVIVLAITGLMCFASFRVIDNYNRLALKQETERFASSLESYILLSVQKESDLKITFSAEGYKLITINEEDQGIIQAISFPRFLKIEPAASQEKEIFLYQSKVVSPTSFRVIRKDLSCSVILSLRGRVRTEC